MKILAIDPGTNLGWALGDGTKLVGFGTQKFEKKDRPGERFMDFNLWLHDTARGVDKIVYEKPLGRWAKSQAQVQLSVGMETRLQEYAFAENIELKSVPIMTLKKATTGNGRAEKEDMVAAVNRIFGLTLTKKEHDAADALALLHYARQSVRIMTEGRVWISKKGDPF